jgi:hypothetical protein
MTPQVHKRFLGLKKKAGAGTASQVVRNALAIYEMIVDYQHKGYKVVLESQDGKQVEMVLPQRYE